MQPPSSRFSLLGRADCELCDTAESLFLEVAPRLAADLQKIDIDGDPGLLARYRLVIPVLLRHSDGEELRWPFPASRLRQFLGIADAGRSN